MPRPIQLVLSAIFIGQMYLAMAIAAVILAIPALISVEAAFFGVHVYCRWVIWTARVLVGLRVEVRGTPPQDGALVVAKHQSFFDIIILCSVLPRPRFIMKRELLYTPIIGQYALRIGCVPVDRGKGGAAITKMKADVARGAQTPGQLIIYPQGTRVPPGEKRPYKIGAGLLYEQLAQPCHLMATNCGVFWPKHGLMRRRGTAVVEFLAPPIAPGMPMGEFMREIEGRIETASDRLLADARAAR